MSRYLVVDDNRAFAENLAEIIGDETGAEVTIFNSGPEAINALSTQHFDAVVTDLRMPGMSGTEFLQQVRRVDAGVPAIAVSAYADASVLNEARRIGFLTVLPKPVPIERLLGALKRAHRAGIVLVLEDDTQLAEALTEALSEKGYTPVLVRAVDEMAALEDVTPFVALVDLRLTADAGARALSRLEERFPRLPIVVVTEPTALRAAKRHTVLQRPLDTPKVLLTLDALYSALTATPECEPPVTGLERESSNRDSGASKQPS